MSLRDELEERAQTARQVLACEAVARAEQIYPELLESLRKDADQGRRVAYINVPSENVSPTMRRAIATALLVRLRADGLTAVREVVEEGMNRYYAYKVSW